MVIRDRCNPFTPNYMKIRIPKLIILVFTLTFLNCKSESNNNHMETIKKNHKSAEVLWRNFLIENTNNRRKETPLSFYFCDNKKDANECAELVVKGIKKATATSLWWYKKNNEQLPKVGDQYIVTDWNGNAKAIIETTKVEQVPYNKITPEFAKTEGEGDKSLDYWKRVHEAYYKREMEPHGDKFDENMIIVCEYFKTIYLK
ncbi:ASCH domain-containing protein [uncultured Tenacibaculum sp.]|uniref:ASCH domain-containing protein n=1 Tax=uncultured Tenacibaculum sp. TaxID=174713 RepID=UPI0026186228|nr:ASCH domain-containing protein [uncultured Tenacibaculum sp.]